MVCSYCRKINGKHDSRCPLADEFKSKYYCSICKDGIFNGEEYVVNDDGYYAHFECVDIARDLAKFLGYEIKEMEDTNDY